jgi:MFS transporter, FHS family, glucose/mannose:H+ symporter
MRAPSPHSEVSPLFSNEESAYEKSSNRKLILAGQIAFFPTGILQTLLGPMLSILIARWALNDTQAGNLFLVQFLASLVGVQLSGILLARFGFRPAFLSGLLLMAGGVATLYLGSPLLGMASVACFGLGLGLIVPSDNLLIAEIGSGSGANSRAGAVSLLNFFWGTGAVFCSLMVAWSAVHKLLPLFLGSVSVFLVLLAVAMRNLPFPAAAEKSAASSSESAISSPSLLSPPSSSLHSWRELVKMPAIWLFATVFFLYPGAETAVGGWIGSYVSRLGPRGAAMASMMPAFFWSALTVGRALGTAFLRHFSERRVLQTGFAAGAAGIALMLSTSTLTGVTAGALITGLSFATLYPVTVARLSQRFGVAARSIGAVMFSLASAGPAVIPWMVGVISHATGSLRAGMLLPLTATMILFVVHLFDW